MLDKIKSYLEYRSVFTDLDAINKYRRTRNSSCVGPEIQKISVKAASTSPMLVRPGTMDAITLWDVFHEKYHMPMSDLVCDGWIISLGANVGYATAHLAHQFPNANIVAVELDRDNAIMAEKNTALLRDRCHIVNAAVWVTDDEEISYGGEDVHDLSIIQDRVDVASQKVAKTVTIKRLMKDFNIESVDYLKMDIEGAEAELMKGDTSWLEHVRAINIEVHSPPADYDTIKEVLERNGFDCVRSGNQTVPGVYGIRPD